MELDPIVISEQRAQAVASYLLDKGVPGENIIATAFGATWARYGLDTKESKEGRNRRVQLRLRYKLKNE
jgi:outer membrane protein OmpA-like peptidoglycan-associated protein